MFGVKCSLIVNGKRPAVHSLFHVYKLIYSYFSQYLNMDNHRIDINETKDLTKFCSVNIWLAVLLAKPKTMNSNVKTLAAVDLEQY